MFTWNYLNKKILFYLVNNKNLKIVLNKNYIKYKCIKSLDLKEEKIYNLTKFNIEENKDVSIIYIIIIYIHHLIF